MREDIGSSRRKYLKSVGSSLGILALSGAAEASSPDKNEGQGSNNDNSKTSDTKGGHKGGPKKPNPNFDPHNADEVRGFNVAFRRASEQGKKHVVKRLSAKQKEAFKDSNRVTTTVVKHKKLIDGEMTVVNTESETDDSIAKKWGWDE